MGTIIAPDGTQSPCSLDGLSPGDRLTTMQNAVGGGLIEIVYINQADDTVMLCNEEGLLKGMPFNESATQLAARTLQTLMFIVGPVLVLSLKNEWDIEEEEEDVGSDPAPA